MTQVLAPLVSPGTREEGSPGQARALRNPSTPSVRDPTEALLTWEAPLYGCPKWGKDIVAVPGLASSSLAEFPSQPRGSATLAVRSSPFLTRLRVPSAGSSARLAQLEAEPRAARVPSPGLRKAPRRPVGSRR